MLTQLFLTFLKIGCFAFGGAYGAIPLIQEEVLSQGWLTEVEFLNIIAISESTPGPIMVNAATYIGQQQGGFWGALVATLGVVLPSFLIIILLTAILHNFIKQPQVQAVLKGIKPSLMGVILATGLCVLYDEILKKSLGNKASYKAIAILVLLLVISYCYKLRVKKELSPIALISVAAILGCLL